MSHPSFGTVHIKGEFPRFKPRVEREDVTEAELETLTSKLRAWVAMFFDPETQATYFEDLIYTVALYTAYVNPFHDIASVEMELGMQTYFWLWHGDDVLEMAIERNIPFSTVDQALDQFIGVLRGQVKNFVDVEGCPGFRSLFNALVTIHAAFEKHADEHENIMGYFMFLQRYVEQTYDLPSIQPSVSWPTALAQSFRYQF